VKSALSGMQEKIEVLERTVADLRLKAVEE
jgi:hypothetical protein